jgi:hypothetical protein
MHPVKNSSTPSEADAWEKRFNHLLEYGREYGNYNAPCHYQIPPNIVMTGSRNFGRWLDSQKQQRKQGYNYFLLNISYINIYIFI